jgi:hypothetical protein
MAPGRDDELLVDLPVRAYIKQLPVGCSGCATKAPFTLREFEAGPTMPGWQLRLVATEIGPAASPRRVWRWDLFCPACAGELGPRPDGSVRIGGLEAVDLGIAKPDEGDERS